MNSHIEICTAKLLKKIEGIKAVIVENKKSVLIFYHLKDERILVTKNSSEAKFCTKEKYNDFMSKVKSKTTITNGL